MFQRGGSHHKVEITAPPDVLANKLRLQHPPPALLVSQQQQLANNVGSHKTKHHPAKQSVSRHKSHPNTDAERFSVSMEVKNHHSSSASDKRKKKNVFGFLKKKQSKGVVGGEYTDGGGGGSQRAMSRTPEHFGRRPIQDNPMSVPTVRRPHSAASDRVNGIDSYHSKNVSSSRQYYPTNDSDDDEIDQPKTPSTPSTSSSGGNPRLKPFRVAPAPPIPIQTPPTQSQSGNSGYDSLEKYRNNTRLSQSDDGSLVSSNHSERFSIGSGNILDPSCGVPGLIGVKNHGNTCYMNSVMQCLSNTEPLLYYFLSNSYKKDLFSKRKPVTNGAQQPSFSNDSSISQIVIPNSDGAVTECVGLLIKSLWNGQYESKISSFTREVVGLWGEQYRGSAQHDAQEFLLWLVDHLHEDLNHATGEKMTMSPVRKSNEEEMAAETLSDHLQRHDSLIYDLFSAQYHSSLCCPGCGHLSNTFDPYLCVSLSVPRRGSRPFYITMARRYQSSTKLMVFGMSLKITATVKDVQRQLSVEARTLPHYLVISEMRPDGYFKFFRPSDPISIIPEHSSVYAFEVTPYKGEFSSFMPHPSSLMSGGGVPGETIFIVLQCRVGQGEYSKRFGSPMCLRVWRDLTYSQLQSVVFKHMRQYLHDEVNPEVVCRDYIFFKCLVMDGLQGQEYLDPYCPSPFMSPSVEKALSVCKLWGYEPHIKLIAEWEQWVKDTVCTDIPESSEDPVHPSVMTVRDHYSVPLEATLDDCLEWHTKEEKLDDDETYRCSQCSKPQAGATKTISFWTLPDIMVIHFKRFEQDEYSHSKLNTFVKYPIRGLDMSPYLAQPNNPRPFSAVGFKEHMLKAKATPTNNPIPIITKGGSVREKKLKGTVEKQNSFSTLPLKGLEDLRKASIDQAHPKSKQKFVWKKPKKSKKKNKEPSVQSDTTINPTTTTKESNVYDLFAVCNHHGNMDNGHYISQCCNPLDGQWYTYDDHRVIPVPTEERLITQHAYILLYLRRGAKTRYIMDSETNSTETTPTSHWIHRLTQFKMDLSRIIPSLPEPSVSKAQRQASAQTLSTASGVSPDMTGTSMPHIDPINTTPTTHTYMSQSSHYHQLSSGSSGGVPLSPSHSSYGAYPQSPSHSTVSYFSQPATTQPFSKRIGSYHGHTHHGTVSSHTRDTITRTATRL